jgi:hypothetical protein
MDAQQAAERAEKAIYSGIDLIYDAHEGNGGFAPLILAEFAPLLAAKDAEIERIKGAMEILRSDRASVKADRDRLAAEVAELKGLLVDVNARQLRK